jgi:DNA polymerase-3 subunit epsilon
MLPEKIAFVDIETTGMRSFYDRVLEIGILRVENNQITQTFQSLLNPQTYIPSEITHITGITTTDIENAPTFRQIKDDVLEILDDCVFVAHNVRFDYSFIKNEFQRLNHTFSPRHFCTVRLSRALYPQHSHHNLDSIIERFGLQCEARHRAFDDAKILYHFYQKVQQQFPQEVIETAVAKALKQPSLPLRLKTDLKTIPEATGVYIFYSDNGTPLYVGKSINLRERIMSHFAADIRAPLEMKIAQQIESIETITTAGELGALILESHLIKKLLPLYNRKSRLKRELVALKTKPNKDGYNEVYLEPVTTILPENLPEFLGLFKSRSQAKAYLIEIAREHSLCEKMLGLQKTKTECFAYRLGKCKGACVKKESPAIYNLRSTLAFSKTKIKPWPFSGPIMLEEQNTENKKDYFLVDKWCYLGKVSMDEEHNIRKEDTYDPVFDVDLYNILKQFIISKKGTKINLLSSEQLKHIYTEQMQLMETV